MIFLEQVALALVGAVEQGPEVAVVAVLVMVLGLLHQELLGLEHLHQLDLFHVLVGVDLADHHLAVVHAEHILQAEQSGFVSGSDHKE